MSAQDLIQRLEKCKQTGRGNWIARCPAHDDKNPSMTLRECDDGRVLLHCFAGCGASEVISALGLEFDVLFPPKPPVAPSLKPVRRPYPAADVLEALATESMVVLMITRRALEGEPVDRERLLKAVERIERGRELANG